MSFFAHAAPFTRPRPQDHAALKQILSEVEVQSSVSKQTGFPGQPERADFVLILCLPGAQLFELLPFMVGGVDSANEQKKYFTYVVIGGCKWWVSGGSSGSCWDFLLMLKRAYSNVIKSDEADVNCRNDDGCSLLIVATQYMYAHPPRARTI